MAITYEPIATQTGDNSSTTITFSSIPQTYTDLVLVANIFTTVNANQSVRVNGDTATNYSTAYISGNGTSASTGRNINNNAINIQSNIYSASTVSAATVMHFMNYSSTLVNKTVLTRAGNANLGTELFISLWRSSAAITSISIAGATFTTNASFTLYGIKAA